MTHAIQKAVTGSGNAIGTMLRLGTGNSRIQVSNHHPPKTANGIESDAATNATIARPLSATPCGSIMIAIARANGLHSTRSAMGLGSTHPGLTLTGTLATEAGHGVGHGHRSVSVAWLL
jgi:hypothetical protein